MTVPISRLTERTAQARFELHSRSMRDANGSSHRSLADAWADPPQPMAGWCWRSWMVLQSLSAIARGVRFGRKPALTAHQQAEARARRAIG